MFDYKVPAVKISWRNILFNSIKKELLHQGIVPHVLYPGTPPPDCPRTAHPIRKRCKIYFLGKMSQPIGKTFPYLLLPVFHRKMHLIPCRILPALLSICRNMPAHSRIYRFSLPEPRNPLLSIYANISPLMNLEAILFCPFFHISSMRQGNKKRPNFHDHKSLAVLAQTGSFPLCSFTFPSLSFSNSKIKITTLN